MDRLVAEEDIEAVFINKDYAPFSRTRDAAIAEACQNKDVAFRCCSDTAPQANSRPERRWGTVYDLLAFSQESALGSSPTYKCC